MNNNESNNNNQQNNYVIPIEVNTNTNPISQTDTMLNRERANIVNATVMANENIDQKKSTEVNNRYNIKEKSLIQKFLTYVLLVMIVLVFMILAFKGLKKLGDQVIADEETTTTTTTTKSAKEHTIDYLDKMTSLRKFVGKVSNELYYILILLPNGVEVHSPSTHHFVLVTVKEGKTITSIQDGTYRIVSGNLELITTDKKSLVYEIGDNCLISGENKLLINDDQMKMYEYSGSNEGKTLVETTFGSINFGILVESDISVTTIYGNTSTEDKTQIILDGKNPFVKIDGNKLKYNDKEFTLKK